MSEPTVCRHCGYFINYVIPKAPAEPGWVHMPYTSTKPTGPHCDHPEPPTAATLADFLLARIAEDEEWAPALNCTCGDEPGSFGPHLLPSCPARVLAECEAKRRIVARFMEAWEADDMLFDAEEYDGVLRLLALPYADHPDYREEWRP